jgi:hypothetical protein
MNQRLTNMDLANRRAVGAFDPTSFGSQFDFLVPQQGQFAGADFGAGALADSFDRRNQIIAASNAIAGLGPSVLAGNNALLSQGGGNPAVQGALGAVSELGNQQQLGSGLFGQGGPFASQASPFAQLMSGLQQGQGQSGVIQALLQGTAGGFGGLQKPQGVE